MKTPTAEMPASAHPDRVKLRAELLKWYMQHKRDLPWRDTNDPYCVWVSEIMLQQTRASVVAELKGVLPKSAAELRTLPGIGSYTSAAIASIVHREPVAVVDGNVERVIARLMGLEVDKKSKSKRAIEAVAQELVEPREPGDFNQAMMELGATVCVPRNPPCRNCPIASHCRRRGEHKPVPRAAMTSQDVSYALA